MDKYNVWKCVCEVGSSLFGRCLLIIRYAIVMPLKILVVNLHTQFPLPF